MSNDPRWPVILFDLDGTLANTIPLIVASYQHTFRDVFGVEVTDDEAKSWIGRPLIDLFEELYPDRGTELTAKYRAWNEEHFEELLAHFPGVDEFSTELIAAGLQVGVVTSKMRRTAQLTMDLAGIDPAVELLVAMEDTKVHKPNPDPLLYALTLLHVSPNEAVYVGDAVFDIQSAQAAGLAVIAVTWGAGKVADLKAENPDYLVDTLDELRTVLLGAAIG